MATNPTIIFNNRSIAGRRRTALGPDLLSPLCATLRLLRNPAVCELLAEADRDPYRRARKLRSGAVRAHRSAAGTADDRGDLAGGRLARRFIRQLAVAAATGRGGRSRASLRGPGSQHGEARAPADSRDLRRRGSTKDPCAGYGHDLARPRRGGDSSPLDRGGERPLAASDFEFSRRIPALVSRRADSHGHLGGDPVQAGSDRQRPLGALAATILCAVAPTGRGDVGPLERPLDSASARLIGRHVADVGLQFRSVRMLIAQDQLENVKQARATLRSACRRGGCRRAHSPH